MYGATRLGRRSGKDKSGLSPRVRGNPEVFLVYGIGSRSIPACTGQPIRVAHRYNQVTVYPRVYGATVPAFGMLRSS